MSSTTERQVDEPVEDELVREIGHDEYDPIGTLVLIGLYFLILVAMWLFMYFVEFLGNGPTVVGWLGTGVGVV
ncbi:hypothetical protein [Halopiger goleimassiliensis]|uniref:hypothetical protein n=1 Tax=Halopiger goleimassiliensis TaxID=1293048 RepID=UPI00067825A9|nr:hypothetical protein [Halopiger goleimassiliensis]